MQFKISCSWEVYATAYVEANSLKEAIEIVKDDDFALPTDTHYIDGTFTVDESMSKVMSKMLNDPQND